MKLRLQVIGFGVAAVCLAAVVGAIGLLSANRLGGAIEQSVQAGQALQASQRADMMHDAVRGDVLLAMLGAKEKDARSLDEAESGLKEHAKDFDEQFRKLAARPLTDEARAALVNTTPVVKAYTDAAAAVVKAARNDIEAGRKAMPAFQAAFTALEKQMAEQSELIEKTGHTLTESVRSGVTATVIQIAAALIVASGLLAAGAMWLARQMSVPMAHAVEVAGQLAKGDLTARIAPQGNDETQQLLRSMATMQDNLANIVGEVKRNAEQVATASEEIARGNQDLSIRTEQQASALQETASTMDSLGTTVRHNADSAAQANQLSAGATAVAQKGGLVMSQVVETMRDINDSSRKIADIISVIDGIAFQTNILALNAAVEAARAGAQGRGFAVVASEVRSLAQRSTQAAHQIKALIGNSVERVEHGSSLVDEAGRTMDEIVGAIRRAADLVAEISSASAEQSTSVGQVGQAVSQMDQATQQNAALVEESAAAADSLKQQARQLVQAVAVFKLDASNSQPPDGASVTAITVTRALERQGPERASNVSRPTFGAKPSHPATATTGTDDWASF